MKKCSSCSGAANHDDIDLRIRNLQKKNDLLTQSVLSLVTQLTDSRDRSATQRNLQALIPRLTRIVGGTEVARGMYAESCLIGTRNWNGTISWFCTGVLIDRTTVLSAAHCINSTASSFVVALNLESMFVDLSHSDTEIIDVRKVVVHPNYYTHRQGAHDIAVLVLQEAAITTPVRLATTVQINQAESVRLVGFGNNDKNSSKGFGIKREVLVDIKSLRRNNQDNLNQDEAKYGFDSDLEFIAGGEGKDSCNGDSGGPAYIEVDGQRFLAGLTSRAVKNYSHICADGGVYTRVDMHQNFIASVQSAGQFFF